MAVIDVGKIGANVYTEKNNTIVLNSSFNRINNYVITESVMDKTVTLNLSITSLTELTANKEYVIGYIQLTKLFPKINAPLLIKSGGYTIHGVVDKKGVSTNGRLTMISKNSIPANTEIFVECTYNIGG